MTHHSNRIGDTVPDPIEELGLDDDEFRSLFGGTSIEEAVERLAKQVFSAPARRPALV